MEDKENSSWKLDSGVWDQDSQYGYITQSLKDNKIPSLIAPLLIKQLLNLPFYDNKIFPPEFKYHPETGKPLKRTQGFNANDVWIAPYGQSVFIENQNRKDNGLQYSRELKTLKNKIQTADEKAQTEIPFSFSGSMEFFSICVGTDIPQLIALNKNNGDLYLLIEASNAWEKLDAISSLLDGCPKEWQDYWGIESYYDVIQKKHILLLPTNHGLAELSIHGKDLKYSINYYGSGKCLGKPIYWNNHIYVLISHNDKVKIWNHNDKSYIDLSGENFIQYFYSVVFDNRHLVWLGSQGKCIVSLNVDRQVSAKFERWLPNYQVDFNFGSPFMDKEGDFYQLFLDSSKNNYVYLPLNSTVPIAKPTNSPRFTTGSSAYDFEEKISHRKNKANIWNDAKQSEHSELFVPLMEDQNQDRDLVLGICFKNIGAKSKDSILHDSSKQFISLFIDTPNHGVHHFYSGQLADPIKKSRFFYHHNRLYFYHPDLSELQGWEAQA